MWLRLRKLLPVLAAVLGIISYGISIRKACRESNPWQCLAESMGWYGDGVLVARKDQVASRQEAPPAPTKDPARPSTPPSVEPVPKPSAPASSQSQPPPLDRRMEVQNDGTEPLHAVHATSCDVKDWGRDRLGATEVIPPGQKKVFDFGLGDTSRNCCFDLRAVYASGVQINRFDVNVCRELRWIVKSK